MKLLVKDLKKSFGKKQVLKGVNYEFEKGNIYGLIGRNGAGKTTFFNCLTGNINRDSGCMILKIEQEEVLKFEDIGFVSAAPNLPQFLTGYEFIKCYIDLHNKEAIGLIDSYFDLMRLNQEDRHSLIKTYSFGMKNKIQLMTCLISKPKIILLDEPLTSFDVVVAHDIKQILLSMKEDHIIIFSTHILQLAEDICDDFVLLSDGHLKDASFDCEEMTFEDYIMNQLKVV